MMTLALKLTLTPILIGAASLAGRRWGPAISGWLVGLPLTSGPVIFLLALAHGESFAAAAAAGTLAGTIAECVFCLAYGWIAWRGGGWWAVVGGCVAFLLGAFALRDVTLSLAPLCAVIALALLASLWLMPDRRRAHVAATTEPPASSSAATRLPWWDLPARMIVATVFVVLLTDLAPALGPQMTGLLAPFPLYATILAAFAQRQQGAEAATRVLRGLLLGLFSFASFFTVLALLLERLGVGLAFVGAVVAALAAQGCTLWLMRRGAGASERMAGEPRPS